MSAGHHGAGDGPVISLTAGSRIAGYRLEERIGQGGMAVVFRALDERLDRTVALKLLAPALVGNKELRQRFIGESRAAATIDDPHIVPVFAAGEADGLLFIAMRYVAGGDAQSLLKREGPLPPGRMAAIISPVASALDAAHRAGLVHRDVKPSNMLTDVLPGRPPHVYLSDFGVSKSVAATSGLTVAGAILGTLAYMSPEQVRSQPVDGRADQYALACSACELLSGAPPFQRDEPAALMYAHLFEDPPRLTSRRPDLAPAVDDVLSKALAKAPDDRFAGCGEFADALRGALGLHPYRSGPRPIAAATHPPVTAVAHPPTVAASASAPAPTRPDLVTDSGQRRAGDGGRVRHRLRMRRLIVVAACVTAAAGLAAGLLLVPGSPAPPVATLPISVKSAFPAVTGDVYVVYQSGKNADAAVSGEVGQAADGEVATLYAQQFPYRNAPTVVSSVILHPTAGGARYAFQVTPTLATRYRVELFRSIASSAPIAMSGVKTIYVSVGQGVSNTQDCGGPVCDESAQVTYEAPSSALKTEMSKTPYVYFGLNPSKAHRQPPPPKLLALGAGHGAIVGTQETSANRFVLTVSFSFTVGHDSYDAAVAVCIKDTVATDGIGLPGHHGCGDQRIPNPTVYLG
ncbi:MAG TPA: serine/threonine-protein kinase [Trebonia sp.]|nr:serine/threonine-protein kinase [Trebonia sp.]